MDRLYYTPNEVAVALSISSDAVLDLINRGELPALRVSPRIIRIPIAAFDLWRSGFVPTRRRVFVGQEASSEKIGAGESLPEAATLLRA